MSAQQIGPYRTCVEVGNIGTPGASILHCNLMANAPTGEVSSFAETTQAIAPPFGTAKITGLTGRVRHTGYGDVTKIAALQGAYQEPFPPPAIGSKEGPFHAYLDLDDSWNGTDGFTSVQLDVSKVSAKSAPCQ